MISGAQAALAQAPPATDRGVLIWSDHDLSLHSGEPAARSETEPPEPGLLLPHDGFFGPRQGDFLLCEPGEFGLLESPALAYAQVRKQQGPQAR
jgi:hypothetical protein